MLNRKHGKRKIDEPTQGTGMLSCCNKKGKKKKGGERKDNNDVFYEGPLAGKRGQKTRGVFGLGNGKAGLAKRNQKTYVQGRTKRKTCPRKKKKAKRGED